MATKVADRPAVSAKGIPSNRRVASSEEGSATAEFLHRVDRLARKHLGAARPEPAVARPPQNAHVDLLAIEMWASGDLPDRAYFARWSSHLERCDVCAARVREADRRRAG